MEEQILENKKVVEVAKQIFDKPKPSNEPRNYTDSEKTMLKVAQTTLETLEQSIKNAMESELAFWDIYKLVHPDEYINPYERITDLFNKYDERINDRLKTIRQSLGKEEWDEEKEAHSKPTGQIKQVKNFI